MTLALFALCTILAALGMIALISATRFVENAQQMFGDRGYNESAAKFQRAFN